MGVVERFAFICFGLLSLLNFDLPEKAYALAPSSGGGSDLLTPNLYFRIRIPSHHNPTQRPEYMW